MRRWESRREAVFVAALVALAVGAVLVSLLGRSGYPHEHSRREAGAPEGLFRSSARSARDLSSGGEIVARRFAGDLQRRAAERMRSGENESYAAPASHASAWVVERFVRLYLRYEVGNLTASGRAALRHAATPELADQLLSAPVRIPPGLHPPSERFVALGAIRPAGFDGGERGFSATAITRQNGRAQILGVSVVERDRRLVVAGVGR